MFKYQSRPLGVTFSRSEMASKSNGNKVEDSAKQAKGKFRFNLVHFVVDHYINFAAVPRGHNASSGEGNVVVT